MSNERQRLRAAIEHWVAFWDRREPPDALASTRILVGTVVSADLLIAAATRAMPALWSPPPLGMASGLASNPLPPVARWLGATPETATLLWSVSVVSALLFLFGAFHRYNSWVLAFALAELARMQPDGDGFDRLMRIAVPILALSQAGARWSFDAWLLRKRGKAPPEKVPAWPRYLLLLQLAWMYFSAAHLRDGPAWWPWGGFAAIAQVLADPHFARFPIGSFTPVYPLTQVATVTTMLFEGSAPLVLFVPAWYEHETAPRWAQMLRNIRWGWLPTGVMLHLGIMVTLKIGAFPLGMLALYPALLHPDDLRKVRGFFRRPR
jgi:hypothetical protein